MAIPRVDTSLIAAILLDFPGTRPEIQAIDPRWLADGDYARRALQIAQDWRTEEDGPLTLQGLLIALQRSLGEADGAITEWVAGLPEVPAAPANVRAYGAILRKDWERRQVRELAGAVFTALGDPAADVDSLVGKLSRAGDLVLGRKGKTVSGTDALLLHEQAKSSGATVVATGFSDLDRLLNGGLRPCDLCVVAGRPGMGKSTFAVDVTRSATLCARRVGYFTLEMSPQNLAARLVATGSPQAIRLIEFSTANSLREIEAQAGRWKLDGVEILVVDYLGLVYPNGGRSSRYEVVTEVSHAMKRLAMSVELPILAAHQMSRGVTQREVKRPQLADLRDSGAVEEDADMVVMLHRPGYYLGNQGDPEAYAYLEKHREGETGDVRLTWFRRPPHFTNYTSFPG